MAITLDYLWPVNGTSTAPTATANPPEIPTSSVKFNAVAVQLSGDGVATSVQITHNLQLTTTELADSFPEVRFEPTAANAPSGFYVSAKTSNTVTVNWAGTFSGTFGIVRISRPFRPTL